MKLRNFLYLLIFIEGYVVLSTEIIAIRQLIPFVGNATDIVAIIIAAVLVSLAFGYYRAGTIKVCNNGKVKLRSRIIKNFIISAIFITLASSYTLLQIYFQLFDKFNITDRIIQTTIYSVTLLVLPVYLLGQTIPLISNYFSHQELPKVASRVLFFSTIGSFLGAILSTLIFMSYFGVNNTIIINILLMFFIILFFSKKIISTHNIILLSITIASIAMNSNYTMKLMNVISNNHYSTITIKHLNETDRILDINHSNSAKYSPDKKSRFQYVQYIEENFVFPLEMNYEPNKILVIGAGGFIIGVDDETNEYIYIDIDSSLKDLSEKHLLKENLTENKKFIASPARAFFNSNKIKFDLIILDAYSNELTIPPQLITTDFFKQVKDALADNGILVFNAVTNPSFKDKFSVKLDNTLRSVFKNLNRQTVGTYDMWDLKNPLNNVIYSYFNHNNYSDDIYTDNKNSHFLDSK